MGRAKAVDIQKEVSDQAMTGRHHGRHHHHVAKSHKKTIRRIKEEQQFTGLRMRRNPFMRVAKGIAQKHKKDARMSSNAKDMLQSGVEDMMIHLISSSADMAEHRGVHTVAEKDVLLAAKTCLPGCSMMA